MIRRQFFASMFSFLTPLVVPGAVLAARGRFVRRRIRRVGPLRRLLRRLF